ncbi:hypothetical protein [Caldivirga sp. UBA161]|uniref:hypothetical protein n=1 Tax=Caldivirga sp. UBA161 TaxID=1915569 RepID=UPI0025C1DD27|nr:hypothetical protein [Caldivirga sp. UBA161]
MAEDLASLVSTPRRISLLALLEDGPKSVQEITRLVPHMPLSIIVYDLEQMRARGIVVKRNGKYFITDKGSELLSKVPSEFNNMLRGLSTFYKVLNLISLRSAWVYLYYINPLILLAISTPLVLLSVLMSWITSVKLILLFPYVGPMLPWYVTLISLLIYVMMDYVISYRLKPIIIHLRELANVMVSLVPISVSVSLISLLYYFTAHVTEQVLIPFYIISYLTPIMSLTILATLTALDTGVPFEHAAIIYLAILYIPSSIVYLTIMNL